MNITVNIDDELKAVAAAETPLRQLEAELEAELKEALAQRPTPQNHNRPFDLRETLRQLRQGVPLGQGMAPRLYAVLKSEQMARFRFRTPGLGPLVRLRERLLQEQRALAAPAVVPVLFEYRYTGKPWGKVAGQRRQTGDVLQLTEEQSALWASVLEPVGVPAPPGGGEGAKVAGGGEGTNPTQQPASPPTGSGVSKV